jgi:hypothetical protein
MDVCFVVMECNRIVLTTRREYITVAALGVGCIDFVIVVFYICFIATRCVATVIKCGIVASQMPFFPVVPCSELLLVMKKQLDVCYR